MVWSISSFDRWVDHTLTPPQWTKCLDGTNIISFRSEHSETITTTKGWSWCVYQWKIRDTDKVSVFMFMYLTEMTFCRNSAEDVASLCSFLVCYVSHRLLVSCRLSMWRYVQSVLWEMKLTTPRVIGMKKGERQACETMMFKDVISHILSNRFSLAEGGPQLVLWLQVVSRCSSVMLFFCFLSLATNSVE